MERPEAARFHAPTSPTRPSGSRLQDLAGGPGGFGFGLVFFQRRNEHQRLAGVGAMHGLAVVLQRGLGKPLGLAAGFGAPGPGVAVAVQADALDAQQFATAVELRGAGIVASGGDFGEQRPGGRRLVLHGGQAVVCFGASLWDSKPSAFGLFGFHPLATLGRPVGTAERARCKMCALSIRSGNPCSAVIPEDGGWRLAILWRMIGEEGISYRDPSGRWKYLGRIPRTASWASAVAQGAMADREESRTVGAPD